MGFLRHIENTFAWIQKLWSMYVYLVLFSLNTPFKYIMPSSKNCSQKKTKSMIKSWLVAFYLRMFTHVHQSRMPVTTMDVNSWSFAFHCESGLKGDLGGLHLHHSAMYVTCSAEKENKKAPSEKKKTQNLGEGEYMILSKDRLKPISKSEKEKHRNIQERCFCFETHELSEQQLHHRIYMTFKTSRVYFFND